MASAFDVLSRPDAGWFLTLYPSAGEAGGSFRSSVPRPHSWVPPGFARDPVRSRSEAARRARGKVRRYCAANRLNRFGTLTYAGDGVHDPAQARTDAALFFRALRAGLGGRPLPYLWVPEWHKSGHGLHLHFAVGQYVPRSLVDASWGHGFVHIKRIGDLPVGSTSLHEARKAAGYLSKYVSKSFDADEDSRAGRLHRYDVAEGFQPQIERFSGTSAEEVRDSASDRMGAAPASAWTSDESEDWQGPPAVSYRWD